MGIKKEVNSDNSDASIAHMLTQGITMGVLNILAIYLGAIGGYETVKQITKK